MKSIYIAVVIIVALATGFAWGYFAKRATGSLPPSDQEERWQRLEASIDELRQQAKANSQRPAAKLAADTPVAAVVDTSAMEERIEALQQRQETLLAMLARLVNAEEAKYHHTIEQGLTLRDAGQPSEAIAAFTAAIAQRPELFNAYLLRGSLHMGLQHWKEALTDFTIAKALAPHNPDPLNNLAWIYATCPEAEFRSGDMAVELALAACELSEWENPAHVSTLAAAYAERGDYDSAVKWQQNCIELSPAAEVDAHTATLRLYEERQPYRATVDQTSAPTGSVATP